MTAERTHNKAGRPPMSYTEKTCRYLRPEWNEVSRRTRLTVSQIVSIWERRHKAALELASQQDKDRHYHVTKLGLDNPYASDDAIAVLVNNFSRERRRRA
jgi:phosphoglucomutase